MRPFEHKDRYDYALNQSSLVLDCGGYHGEFANEIYRRYGCVVIVFEPIPEFAASIKPLNREKISVECVGIAALTGTRSMWVMGDMSGANASHGHGRQIDVPVFGVEFIMQRAKAPIDLLKLNIEGMEYEVLEKILELNVATAIKNIQVQFHRIPDCQKRIDAIRTGLSKTHEQKYCTDFIFEGWSIKP